MKILGFLILYLLPELQAAVIIQNISSDTYQWKTGTWGACDRPTKCGEGHKIRKVSCKNSSGYIVSNSNCDSSTRPAAVKQCFAVCDHHKFVLRWRISQWSPCITRTISSCSGGSAVGVAHRTVECVLNSTHLVVDNEACEYFWDKPDSEMACSVDCPQECVTSKKNITCHVQECSEQISWTEQVNDVLVAPSDESKGCLTANAVCQRHHFVESCNNFDKGKNKYKVKISSWSPCVSEINIPDVRSEEIQLSLHPLVGISQRNISCIDEKGYETDMNVCKLDDIPPLIRQCVVSVDCVVSPWSEWHVQQEGCISSDGAIHPEIRTRQRRLLQLPIGVGEKPCPPLFEQRIIHMGLPQCNKYQWYPLEWTDCQIMLHGNHGEVTVLKPTCGNGLQYRNLTCLRISDMVPVDSELCKDPQPLTVQRCKVPCKRDCQVSHWARWSHCMPFKSNSTISWLESLEEGYRRRVRSILVNPTNGGKSCPHLEELDVCSDIEIFNWQYGNWSECAILDPHATCGRGKRTRDFTCVKYNGVQIDNFMCGHHISLLDDTDTCDVPCPNDCIMSEWSHWSKCSHQCSTSEEVGSYFRNRTILAISGEGGKACRKKRKESESCNLYSCELYKWTTSDWRPCIPLKNNEVINYRRCGIGVQERDVICMRGDNVAESIEMCNYLTKPESKRECHFPCPVNCVTSNFTEWTSCDGSCDPEAVQYRHRLILQSSKHRGRPCPEALVEARPCSSSLDPRCLGLLNKIRRNVEFRWDTGPWSDCQLPSENQACGMGFQIRNVSCLDTEDRPVEPHYCLPPSRPFLPDGPIQDVPSGLRSCEVACSSNCAVSAWSAWTRCSYSYEAKRFRRRELVGISKTNEECVEKIQLVEEDLCPVIPTNLTDSVDDHWMSCIVEVENQTVVTINGRRVSHACGRGYRYKVGIQMNSENGVEPGLERDLCLSDCPIDCQMSSWSEWSDCNVPCGQGFVERRRHVLVNANHMGRPCPETVNKTEIQRDVCNIVCMDYHWFAAGWTNCELDDPEAECGTGTHYRSVRCYDRRTESEADESRCDPLLKPSTVETCRIYCPGECVVSPWHVSQKCTEPCSPNNYQELRRTVYRQPNSTAEPCPPLITRQPCVLNSTCHHHEWVRGPWGSCILPHGAYCGEGVQKRPLICLRSDGRQVDPIQCERIHKPLTLEEPLSKPCYSDCPVDCVLSEWSSWNKSSCTACGPIGVMTRKRYIIQAPSDAGQPCSSEMEQRMPCYFKPCYHWKHSKWSQCDLSGATCGYGLRRRVVECIRFDHLKVDKSHCLVVNVSFAVNSWIDPAWMAAAQEDSHEEELCHVPCPGDCIMSEWSNWHHCQKNCRIGQEVGYQTSSRHILFHARRNSELCPKQLWKTKPCWSDNCDMFAWKLRNDSYICERKDGLIIQGGCTSEPLPCFPACDKLGGTCESSTGVCYCENGRGERTILGPSSRRCRVMGKGPRPPANHSAPTTGIRLKYYPDDSQVSFWMYAMISIGTAFVIFVAVTVYLMCRSSLRQRTVSVERQPSVRRRLIGAVNNEPSPEIRPHCTHN